MKYVIVIPFVFVTPCIGCCHIYLAGGKPLTNEWQEVSRYVSAGEPSRGNPLNSAGGLIIMFIILAFLIYALYWMGKH